MKLNKPKERSDYMIKAPELAYLNKKPNTIYLKKVKKSNIDIDKISRKLLQLKAQDRDYMRE
jgi:hypothetical protein